MSSGDRQDLDAFVSYSHTDKAAARRVQRFLESYPLPARPGTPRRRLRVFRDDTDLRAAELNAELRAALARSRALVVCCSPAAARARWVQEEIDVFLEQDPGRPVIPIIVAGDPGSVLPPRLAAGERRYVDARRAWLLGVARPRVRDELVRVVATIAGEDLRTLIPWDRRRRRRALAVSITMLLVASVATLFVPYDHPRTLARPAGIDGQAVIEFCDVVQDRLLLAARGVYGRGTLEDPSFAAYVAVYPDALAQPTERAWLDETKYLPTGRLLHVATGRGVRERVKGLDVAALREPAQKMAKAWHESGSGSPAPGKPVLEDGFWGGAPLPDVRLAMLVVRLPPPPKAANQPPPPAMAVIAIKDGDEQVHVAAVEDLHAAGFDEKKPPSARGAALGQGLPIAATSREVLVGMPVRPDGGIGGLWRWDRQARTWQRESISGQQALDHFSVLSLVTDPRRPGRVLVSTGPGEWTKPDRKGRYAAGVFERPAAGQPWRPVTLASVDSESPVQLCGFRTDGTLYARIHQTIFATGRYNLLRRWLMRD